MEGVITRKQIAGITIEIQETRIGDDIVLILAGGDKPYWLCCTDGSTSFAYK